jgi:hypothetical protein
MNERLLYMIIFDLLEKENNYLECLIDRGIFFAPELYIGFILGKKIKEEEQFIFGRSVEWKREEKFGGIGPIDLAFKTGKYTFVFEIKLRDTYHEYINDIKKLNSLKNSLNNSYKKYFLAFVDAYQSKQDKDERIIQIENNFNNLKRVTKFKSFDTKQVRYRKKICCVVGLWSLN